MATSTSLARCVPPFPFSACLTLSGYLGDFRLPFHDVAMSYSLSLVRILIACFGGQQSIQFSTLLECVDIFSILGRPTSFFSLRGLSTVHLPRFPPCMLRMMPRPLLFLFLDPGAWWHDVPVVIALTPSQTQLRRTNPRICACLYMLIVDWPEKRTF